MKRQIKLWFTDFWHPSTKEDIQRDGLFPMLSKHWDILLSPRNPDFLIYSCFGYDYQHYDCIRIFYTGENIRPDFGHCDYAFSFDYPVTERNYRLPLYRLYKEYADLFQLRDPERIISEKRKFCCLLSSNPSAYERNNFFHLLNTYKRVDSGGKVQNNIGFQIGSKEDKISWLKDYKFSITFENSSFPGYTSEKLLHGLVTNTIPIYWGNPRVSEDFNPRTFINCHEYGSFDEVIQVVMKIDQNPSLYKEYLSHPFLPDGKESRFCEEEEIIGKFEEIFSNKKFFIPPIKKRLQKFWFIIRNAKRFQDAIWLRRINI